MRRASSTREYYDDSSDYYRYTTGRWLFNESLQFNISALAAIATRCLGHEPASCIKIEKLPEGNFNKSLLLTMANGSQVIARVPNPNSGIPHFTTASEVATMDFARNELGMPVPKVLTWSSHASENPVGAEYIVMEKAVGSPLTHIWPRLSNEEKRDLVQAIVSFEVRVLNHPLGGIGSLYYSKDIPSGMKYLPALGLNDIRGHWVLGPTTDRRFFDDSKGELSLDRGPCKEHCTRVPGSDLSSGDGGYPKNPKRPLRPEGIVGPEGYQPDRALKLSVCRDVLKVVDHILPSNPACQKPVLWHKDLHLDNIFVDPEKPTEIVGLIDWQNARVAPLFDQVSYPSFLDYNGPKVEGLKAPSLPEYFEELDDDAKKRAKKLLVEQTLYKYYDLYTAAMNLPAYHALRYQDTLQGEIVTFVGIALNDGEPTLQGLLMQLASRWDELINGKGGLPCPLHYSAEAIDRQQELEEKWVEGIKLMDDVLESLGGAIRGWEGWVSHEDYEPLKQKLALVREQFIEYFAGDNKEAAEAWARAWPFK
ncbi:hypothetical protein AJ80_04298 [Polytolypa hystricis UAMH7299]|uniref:Altered inheritance of mitochondria protein 9, mitochondrial n=1 Tax=Polytolypa hystricis (strain UAMH7299) TaxID=1447883 RepID=A0A2B7YCF3_POLH7|nr:hypothetical protein AJ80_04298 [Polytolypa hystricis UAMH7299]